MTYNGELFREVRDKILMEPEVHKQTMWGTVDRADVDTSETFSIPNADAFYREDQIGYAVTCTTAACVAGWASQLSGDRFLVTQRAFGRSYGEMRADYVRTADGQVELCSTRAQHLLGLNGDQADELFDACNSREFVLDKLDYYIKEAAKC